MTCTKLFNIYIYIQAKALTLLEDTEWVKIVLRDKRNTIKKT